MKIKKEEKNRNIKVDILTKITPGILLLFIPIVIWSFLSEQTQQVIINMNKDFMESSELYTLIHYHHADFVMIIIELSIIVLSSFIVLFIIYVLYSGVQSSLMFVYKKLKLITTTKTPHTLKVINKHMSSYSTTSYIMVNDIPVPTTSDNTDYYLFATIGDSPEQRINVEKEIYDVVTENKEYPIIVENEIMFNDLINSKILLQ